MRSERLTQVCRDYGHNAGLLTETYKAMQFADSNSERAIQTGYGMPGCWIVSLVEVREAEVLFETVVLTTESKLDARATLELIDSLEIAELPATATAT